VGFVPPHPQRPGLAPPPRLGDRRLGLGAGHPPEIDRRHVRGPRSPLRVSGLVGELRDRGELLVRQGAVVRSGRDLRQGLQRTGGLDCLAHRPLRHPRPCRGVRQRDAFVEDPHHRQVLDKGLALHPQQLGMSGQQPLGLPAAQPVELFPYIEPHQTIQTRRYDTHPAGIAGFGGFPRTGNDRGLTTDLATRSRAGRREP